ncbi:isoprenylcysteine carboxylmethyltransferase family protein [Candidatus Bathyarchaeota archaeon]|nr:isoprenylcysteine carboxylmethyltransferase family protein [Candidatus Bathyarchaeota archaeon]
MSLIPAFELGLWNAWILMVPSLLLMLLSLCLFIEKRAPATGMRLSKTKLSFCLFSKFIYFAAVIYSVFLPLKLGTIWFYAGLLITLIGLVGSMMTVVSWVSTPAGKIVTRGIYHFSRHPIYVTEVLLLLGASMASASWVFLLFPLIVGVGAVYFIKIEEAQCIGHYGSAYREYMNRTPRWIGFPRAGENNRED